MDNVRRIEGDWTPSTTCCLLFRSGKERPLEIKGVLSTPITPNKGDPKRGKQEHFFVTTRGDVYREGVRGGLYPVTQTDVQVFPEFPRDKTRITRVGARANIIEGNVLTFVPNSRGRS